eukprot:IDg1858t1
MRRNHLSVRVRTYFGKLSKGHIQSVKKDFALRVMKSFKNRVLDQRFFCNIDEIAVYFDYKPTRTVQTKGEKSVSIRISRSSANRCTVCMMVAMDGTKVPLFVIFKVHRAAVLRLHWLIYYRKALMEYVSARCRWTNAECKYDSRKFGSCIWRVARARLHYFWRTSCVIQRLSSKKSSDCLKLWRRL